MEYFRVHIRAINIQILYRVIQNYASPSQGRKQEGLGRADHITLIQNGKTKNRLLKPSTIAAKLIFQEVLCGNDRGFKNSKLPPIILSIILNQLEVIKS